MREQTDYLSHHEFSALLLLDSDPDWTGLDRDDLESLEKRQYIEWVKLNDDASRHPRLTTKGRWAVQM